jgi:nucleotide-binding universal stress UspA family protein
MFRKIVLPVDFSERSTGGAHYARALATRFGSGVRALHVLPPFSYAFGGLEGAGVDTREFFEAAEARAKRELADFIAAELAGVAAEPMVLDGDPAHRIVEYAHAENADLIVLPTHGYGPFRRLLLGSVTAKVLHDAGCPVWTGAHMAEAPAAGDIRIGKILCALDLGPLSRDVFCWARRLAEALEAKLSVLHVTPTLDVAQARYFDPDWRIIIENQAREDLEKLNQNLGANAEVIVESGQTAAAVREVAERSQADLVVIGRGAITGTLGRLRANAYAIIREAPCPVISV